MRNSKLKPSTLIENKLLTLGRVMLKIITDQNTALK